MIEQTELDFIIKGEVPDMMNLVEMLNESHEVVIRTIDSKGKFLAECKPVFLYLPNFTTPIERWEYKISVPPDYASRDELERWLNHLGAEGWMVMNQPEGEDDWWYFKRKVN